MKDSHSLAGSNKIIPLTLCVVCMIILVLSWSLNLNVLTRAAQSDSKCFEKRESYPNGPLNFLIKAVKKASNSERDLSRVTIGCRMQA